MSGCKEHPDGQRGCGDCAEVGLLERIAEGLPVNSDLMLPNDPAQQSEVVPEVVPLVRLSFLVNEVMAKCRKDLMQQVLDFDYCEVCPLLKHCHAQEHDLSSALFARCVETKLLDDGTLEIHCKRGLWSVSGRNRKQVEREAIRYWKQYYADGEYGTILADMAVG